MGPRPIELLALDVDGTLADPDGLVRDRTVAAVTAARDRGIHIVVATGRPWMVAERTVGTLGVAGWAVCSNGAMTIRVDDGRVSRNVFLPDGFASTLLPRLREEFPGIGFRARVRGRSEVRTWMGSSPATWGPHRAPGRRRADARGRTGDGFARSLRSTTTTTHDIAGLAVRLRSSVDADVLVQHSGLAFCEIGVAGVDKAVAVAELAAELGVSRHGVVAFGDEVNDAELLAWAGHGVAMGNATQAGRTQPDEVARSNADDGVAHWLEHHLG